MGERDTWMLEGMQRWDEIQYIHIFRETNDADVKGFESISQQWDATHRNIPLITNNTICHATPPTAQHTHPFKNIHTSFQEENIQSDNNLIKVIKINLNIKYLLRKSPLKSLLKMNASHSLYGHNKSQVNNIQIHPPLDYNKLSKEIKFNCQFWRNSIKIHFSLSIDFGINE